MRASARILLSLSLIAGAAAPLVAQRSTDLDNDRWLDNCRNGWNGNDDRGRACEIRAVPVRLAGRMLEIDGRDNGGIRVVGWEGDSVRVTARVQANARTDGAANDLLKEVRITADGRRIAAEGARSYGRNESWAVSYVVYVPRRFDLRLDAHNGGVGVTGVTGRLELTTENGSVSLDEVGGDVRARTQNGSVNVELSGSKWDGRGLDAETQNGSVRLGIPAAYAATVETGTINGRMNTDFPVTLQGRIGRQMTLPLNGGGAPIRVETINGSVSLMRR
ncbi:MAG: hypothetical protein ABIY52_18740 [Gemmatimonadaceae bacterium]